MIPAKSTAVAPGPPESAAGSGSGGLSSSRPVSCIRPSRESWNRWAPNRTSGSAAPTTRRPRLHSSGRRQPESVLRRFRWRERSGEHPPARAVALEPVERRWTTCWARLADDHGLAGHGDHPAELVLRRRRGRGHEAGGSSHAEGCAANRNANGRCHLQHRVSPVGWIGDEGVDSFPFGQSVAAGGPPMPARLR